MKTYTTLIFDLDGTLAVTKSKISQEMAEIFSRASQTLNLAIITGGMFEQIKTQVIDQLNINAQFKNIYVLPTSGAQMFFYNENIKSWECKYEKKIPNEKKKIIIKALTGCLEKVSFFIDPKDIKGEQIEDRDSQITFSALGQEQAPEKKELWDPSESKRREMMTHLQSFTEEFDIKLGGSTSIDITLKGIDKEYGINQFFDYTKFNKDEALFVGDKIIPGGNDWAATKTGIDTQNIRAPEETMQIISRVLGAHHSSVVL